MLPSLGALKGLGSGLYNMGRGALFMGASKGATTGGKIMNGIGHASPLAPVVAGSFKATSQQPGFQPQSTVKSSSHEPQEKWYERHGGPADLPTSPSERMALGSLGGLVGMALDGTVGGAYGAYKDHKAQNASGFQEQSANRTRSDSRSEPLHTEKLSVSREWINQRIQNAVNNGVDTSRLLAFSDRNEEAYNQLSSRDKPLVQAQRDRLSTAKGNRTTAANAAFAATQGPGVHDYFVPGYGGQAASSHSITVPAQTASSHSITVPAQTIPARAASVRTPKLLRNTALAASAGLGAYGLYRAYGAYKDHKAQNASGFQEQSANRTRSDSRSEPLHTEKLSVSREWINQRIQNAVNNGVDTSRLLAFSDRNEEAYNQLSSRDKPLVQAQRDRLSTAKGNRTTAANAAFAATQGPGVHDYFVPGYGGQAASSHSITVPAQTASSHSITVPAQTIPARAASVRTPKLLRNTALAASAGLGAYGLYRALKKEEPTVKSSAELPPVVARALLAKVASGPGFDWHRPVNALSYAAFAAPYLSQTVHDNHKLTTALNAAGLLGLGATSADSLAKGDGLAGYDLAGLGLMGAGLVHGALRPTPTPGAGH